MDGGAEGKGRGEGRGEEMTERLGALECVDCTRARTMWCFATGPAPANAAVPCIRGHAALHGGRAVLHKAGPRRLKQALQHNPAVAAVASW